MGEEFGLRRNLSPGLTILMSDNLGVVDSIEADQGVDRTERKGY
jgi:hypothetical protein